MKRRSFAAAIAGAIAAVVLFARPAVVVGQGDAEAEALAKKLSNPVASLISIPFQGNYDSGHGPKDDGSRFVLNIQPVLPFSLSPKLNLISRTILPVISQDELFPGSGSQSGIGDIVQSLFFSPVEPTGGGWIWGAGPVLLLPTASDDLLGGKKWGLGPTVVMLRQQGQLTYGFLANHIVSVAGDEDRGDVNATFLQPFLANTTKTAWTFSLNTEVTRDWEGETWSVPLNLGASKLLRLGRLPVSLAGGIRFWLDAPDLGPEGVGFRGAATILLPR